MSNPAYCPTPVPAPDLNYPSNVCRRDKIGKKDERKKKRKSTAEVHYCSVL